MKWFRFYSEVIDDPKVQCLPIAARWHWVEMLCIASSSEPRGRLHLDRRLAARCNLTVSRLQALCKQLLSAGLLREEGEFLIPHGWDKRQMASDDVATRVRQHRESNVTVTALDTDTESDKETERDTEQQPQPLTPSPQELKIVRQNIFSLYEQVFGSRLTPHMEAVLRETEQEYPVPWIEEAFKEAAISGARSWRYVDKVLRNWKAEEDNDLAEAQKWGLEGDEAVAFAETVREQRVAQ